MRRYIGIEDLGMTAGQRQTLVAALTQLGRNNLDPNPCNRNHRRVRLDGMAVIFEADWRTEDWTAESVTQYLADVFGVDPATISHSIDHTALGPVVTFSRNGDKLRVIVFGGGAAPYALSLATVLGYLAANAADWGD